MWSNVVRHNAQTMRAHARTSKNSGSSLLEVMLAVAIMAVTALGLIAGQLSTARRAHEMAMREHATWIADSIAESMYTPSGGDTAIRQWNTRAAEVLPHGQALVVDNDATSAAHVLWASLRETVLAEEVKDKPESCGGADKLAGSACIALAFIK